MSVLVQKAFCLEVLADKLDCTSRFHDLPDRPLEDFVIAAINVGPIFEAFVADHQKGVKTLFHRHKEALRASNIHKSNKFVNFGLIEIMFPVVAARLGCDDPKLAVHKVVDLMKQASKEDVGYMVEARKLAWSSSEKKNEKLNDLTDVVRGAKSPFVYHEAILRSSAATTSGHQWAKHYQDGLPWLAQQFDSLQKSKGPLLDRIKEAFDPVRRENPNIRIGILADMCAAAIFLHLSFSE